MAEDDPTSRKLLEAVLTAWGYEAVVADDGEAAWHLLQQQDAPQLVVLDWMMPGLDGPELCRRARSLEQTRRMYLIMLTSLESKQDLVTALDAGADDYVVKPFDKAELKARLEVGRRVLGLQDELATRVAELETALTNIKVLHGLLPICSYCKKVRDDQNYWQQVESYVESHAEVQFSHSVCPDCYETEVKPHLE
jgi:DNA-binding response OmpR family regulator